MTKTVNYNAKERERIKKVAESLYAAAAEVLGMFVWDESAEGGDYWDALHTRLIADAKRLEEKAKAPSLKEVATEAMKQFESYADAHEAKRTYEGDVKALANRDMAAKLREAIEAAK